MILEVCIDSLVSASAAEAGGCNRLELCSSLNQGGLTPTATFVTKVLRTTTLSTMMMVRPRAGNFVYSDAEFQQMRKDIILAHKLQVQGVVFGILQDNGAIDTVRTSELVRLARPMQVTFHRAFDECLDPIAGLEQLIIMGIERVLTSGLQETAIEAAPLLAQLVRQAAGRISIMPGSGINSLHLGDLADIVKATEYHGSFKSTGGDHTSEEEVRKAITILATKI